MPEPIKPDFSWWRAITTIVATLVAVVIANPVVPFLGNAWLLAVLIALLVLIILAAAHKIPNTVLVLAYVAFVAAGIGWAYLNDPQSLGLNLWRLAAFIGIPVATAVIVAVSQWAVQRLFPDLDPPLEALLSRTAEQRAAAPIVLSERPANRILVLFVGVTLTLLIGLVAWNNLRSGGDVIGYLMVAFAVAAFVGGVIGPLFTRRRISFEAGTMTYTTQGLLRSRSQTVAFADVQSAKISKAFTEIRTRDNRRILVPELGFAPKDIGITLFFLLGKRDYLSRAVVNPVAMSLFLGTAALWAIGLGFLTYSILYLDGWNRIAALWAGDL